MLVLLFSCFLFCLFFFLSFFFFFFFFNDTATTEIYTLSLHDALPILVLDGLVGVALMKSNGSEIDMGDRGIRVEGRSEEHTSELQSLRHLVCRLLLEKKKKKKKKKRR